MVIINLGKAKNGKDKQGQVIRLGKYELGRTLGEGNFGKVKFARNTDSGQPFAVKVLEKSRIIERNTTDQVCFDTHINEFLISVISLHLVYVFAYFELFCHFFFVFLHESQSITSHFLGCSMLLQN